MKLPLQFGGSPRLKDSAVVPSSRRCTAEMLRQSRGNLGGLQGVGNAVGGASPKRFVRKRDTVRRRVKNSRMAQRSAGIDAMEV
jgi:hypothetical protein